MKLSQLKAQPVPAVYMKDGEPLNLMVEADMLTPQFLDEMALLDAAVGKTKGKGKSDAAMSFSEQARRFSFFVNVLSRVIAAWDLTEEDGKAIPVSVDSLRTLPLTILADLFEVCVKAGIPEADDKKKSGATISQAVN